jgi:hypothetical protein
MHATLQIAAAAHRLGLLYARLSPTDLYCLPDAACRCRFRCCSALPCPALRCRRSRGLTTRSASRPGRRAARATPGGWAGGLVGEKVWQCRWQAQHLAQHLAQQAQHLAFWMSSHAGQPLDASQACQRCPGLLCPRPLLRPPGPQD